MYLKMQVSDIQWISQVDHFYMSVNISVSVRNRTCVYACAGCVNVCVCTCVSVHKCVSQLGRVMGSEQEQQGLLGPSVLQSLTSSCLTALLSQAESCSVVRLECAN